MKVLYYLDSPSSYYVSFCQELIGGVAASSPHDLLTFSSHLRKKIGLTIGALSFLLDYFSNIFSKVPIKRKNCCAGSLHQFSRVIGPT